MGSTATLVTVNEYLHTVYEPECDYVDGVLEDRNVGEEGHSDIQSEFVYFFRSRRAQLGLTAYAELRVQVAATRFRVPDVCLVPASRPKEPILTKPPLVCIEILSPEDRMNRMQKKIDDYLGFGVQYVWVLDPATRRAWAYSRDGMHEAHTELRLDEPAVVVPLSEIFAAS